MAWLGVGRCAVWDGIEAAEPQIRLPPSCASRRSCLCIRALAFFATTGRLHKESCLQAPLCVITAQCRAEVRFLKEGPTLLAHQLHPSATEVTP